MTPHISYLKCGKGRTKAQNMSDFKSLTAFAPNPHCTIQIYQGQERGKKTVQVNQKLYILS